MGSQLDLEDVVYDHPLAREQLAALIEDNARLRTESERLREHHKTAVENWTLEAQNVKTLEEENERLKDSLEGRDSILVDDHRYLRAEVDRLRDLINDMSRAIDCLSTGTPLRDLDEILLRVWKLQREGE